MVSGHALKQVHASKEMPVHVSSGRVIEGDEGPTMIALPGIYTPSNDKSKTTALKMMFSNLTYKYDLPEPEVIPPHLLIAFEVFKRTEVLALAAEYPDETMKLGFFTTHDPETAQLIAKSPDEFNRNLAAPL